MLTVSEAATALGLSEGRTRALIKSGKLTAIKKGRQWMIYERSVYERAASKPHAGRPRSNQNPTIRTAPSERAYSLYLECKNVFSQRLDPPLIKEAKGEEERAFYVHVYNFFLGRKCDDLVNEGVF